MPSKPKTRKANHTEGIKLGKIKNNFMKPFKEVLNGVIEKINMAFV
jgi:hypothetical protein